MSKGRDMIVAGLAERNDDEGKRVDATQEEILRRRLEAVGVQGLTGLERIVLGLADRDQAALEKVKKGEILPKMGVDEMIEHLKGLSAQELMRIGKAAVEGIPEENVSPENEDKEGEDGNQVEG